MCSSDLPKQGVAVGTSGVAGGCQLKEHNNFNTVLDFCLVYREQLLKLHVTIPMSKSTESQVLKGWKCINHHYVINII